MHRQKEGKRLKHIKTKCKLCKAYVNDLLTHMLSKHKKVYQRKREKENKVPLEKF